MGIEGSAIDWELILRASSNIPILVGVALMVLMSMWLKELG